MTHTPPSSSRLGSARSGTLEAWYMRVTSTLLIPLSLLFVWIVLGCVGKDYTAARAYIQEPFRVIVLILFISISAHHMALGMKSIILDYVHSHYLKELSLIANILFSLALALTCIYALLKISFS